MSDSVALDFIQIDGGTQPRAEIDDYLVSEYADAMESGAEFPPVVVFYDGVSHWLADGFHRTHAARRVGAEEVPAEVRNGTKRDAVLYSVGANSAHGKRRTNADKRKAVLTLLKDDEWSQWSDREIARQCGVNDKTVGNIRRELTAENPQSEPTQRTYTTRHGDTAKMNTIGIGRSRKKPKETKETPDPPLEAKQEANRPLGVGIRYAHEAIAVLKNIPKDDGLRDEGFDTVVDWIETNR